MIQRARSRLNRTTPGTIMLLIVLTASVAIAAFVISITALTERVDERGEQATRDALCAVWAYQVPRPGEPGPTTDRGRLMVDRALEQYRALGCTPER